MKKGLTKLITFIALFAVIFSQVQWVLHYRWSGDEDLYTRNALYAEEPENSIDVLFLGTSEIYAGVTPMILYHDYGITSWNLAISQKSAITTYYQLEYALEYQTPKILVCDFDALFDSSLPSGGNEGIYRKVVDAMPDFGVKSRLIKDICKEDKTQRAISYYFPLFRYHTMWKSLGCGNFSTDHVVDTEVPSYEKGALLMDKEYRVDDSITEITESLWDTTGQDVLQCSDVSIKYYDKMIKLCQENDITVVALIAPRLGGAAFKTANWGAMEDYFDSRGVDVLNYITYEEVMRMGFDLQEDYYDSGHLNYKGSFKWSKDIGEKLKEIVVLPDHRDDDIGKMWNKEYDAFSEIYGVF